MAVDASALDAEGLRRYAAPIMRTLRRIALGLVAASALVALVWAAMTEIAIGRLEAWVAEQRAQGLDIAYADVARGGFPSVRLTLSDVVARQTDGVTLTTARMALVWAPWAPRRLVVEPAAPIALAPSGLIVAALDGRLEFSGDAQEGRTAAAWSELDVTLGGRALAGTGPGRISLAAAAPQQTGGRAQAVLEAALVRVLIPGGMPIDLAPDLSVAARLDGVPATLGAAHLALWREGGGRLVVERVTLRSGALDAFAAGSATLDGALRPEGAGVIEATGLSAWIDRATEAAPQLAGPLLPLRLLARGAGGPEGGGKVSLPISLRDGRATLGGLPVARLAPLAR